MILITDIILILLLYFLFGFIHSFLASEGAKLKFRAWFGELIAFYRLIYNLLSLLLFYLLYELSPKPDLMLYDLNYPYDILIFALQIISLLGLIFALKRMDLGEFLGTSQIKRWYNDNYDYNKLDEDSRLITAGMYKYTRHPIYFFSILFLALRPSMTLFYFVSFISITAYFYTGAFFEEKKLMRKFGQAYSDYRNNVPMIFPFRKTKGK